MPLKLVSSTDITVTQLTNRVIKSSGSSPDPAQFLYGNRFYSGRLTTKKASVIQTLCMRGRIAITHFYQRQSAVKPPLHAFGSLP